MTHFNIWQEYRAFGQVTKLRLVFATPNTIPVTIVAVKPSVTFAILNIQMGTRLLALGSSNCIFTQHTDLNSINIY